MHVRAFACVGFCGDRVLDAFINMSLMNVTAPLQALQDDLILIFHVTELIHFLHVKS